MVEGLPNVWVALTACITIHCPVVVVVVGSSLGVTPDSHLRFSKWRVFSGILSSWAQLKPSRPFVRPWRLGGGESSLSPLSLGAFWEF